MTRIPVRNDKSEIPIEPSARALRNLAEHQQWAIIGRAIDRYNKGEIGNLVALGLIASGILVLDEARTAALASAAPEQAGELEALRRERDAWHETALLHCKNEAYYRGLVIAVGEQLGDAAYTADDGSRMTDVLCAKVPELVKAALAREPETIDSAARAKEETPQPVNDPTLHELYDVWKGEKPWTADPEGVRAVVDARLAAMADWMQGESTSGGWSKESRHLLSTVAAVVHQFCHAPREPAGEDARDPGVPNLITSLRDVAARERNGGGETLASWLEQAAAAIAALQKRVHAIDSANHRAEIRQVEYDAGRAAGFAEGVEAAAKVADAEARTHERLAERDWEAANNRDLAREVAADIRKLTPSPAPDALPDLLPGLRHARELVIKYYGSMFETQRDGFQSGVLATLDAEIAKLTGSTP